MRCVHGWSKVHLAGGQLISEAALEELALMLQEPAPQILRPAVCQPQDKVRYRILPLHLLLAPAPEMLLCQLDRHFLQHDLYHCPHNWALQAYHQHACSQDPMIWGQCSLCMLPLMVSASCVPAAGRL